MNYLCEVANATVRVVSRVRRTDNVCSVPVSNTRVAGFSGEACLECGDVCDFLVAKNPNVRIVEAHVSCTGK